MLRRAYLVPSLAQQSFRTQLRLLSHPSFVYPHCAMSSSPSPSASATISLPSLLSASVDLAQHAGKLIQSIFTSGNLGAIDKANPSYSSSTPSTPLSDPQTLADLAAQRCILSSLSSTFPGLHIVGEEGDIPTSPSDIIQPSLSLLSSFSFPSSLLSLPLSSVCVWVDPLDGTKEFTLGYTESVTVLIGITVNGRAVAGVIGQPFTGNVCWGCEGVGVVGVKEHSVKNFHDEQFTSTSSPPPSNAPSSRIIATTRSHFTPLLSSLLSSLHPTSIVRSGGAGSKSLLLLGGQVDCYYFPSPGLKYWDVIAPEAVIKAAGGRCTDAWGSERVWDEREGKAEGYRVEGGLIATMKDHDYYVLPKGTSITSKI